MSFEATQVHHYLVFIGTYAFCPDTASSTLPIENTCGVGHDKLPVFSKITKTSISFDQIKLKFGTHLLEYCKNFALTSWTLGFYENFSFNIILTRSIFARAERGHYTTGRSVRPSCPSHNATVTQTQIFNRAETQSAETPKEQEQNLSRRRELNSRPLTS